MPVEVFEHYGVCRMSSWLSWSGPVLEFFEDIKAAILFMIHVDGFGLETLLEVLQGPSIHSKSVTILCSSNAG